MLKKIILVVLVLLAVVLFLSYLRSSQSAPGGAGGETQAVPAASAPTAEPVPEGAGAQQEVQEQKEVPALFVEEGTEIPTIDVFDEEVIHIAETEAVGGM